MYDLVIRNGFVVDGSGTAGRHANVAVNDGRIVEIGGVEDTGQRVIDADGLAVSPGFVDVHTHYDAQVFWDPTLSPSPLHGVTTVMAGNCGFTLAPIDAEAADYLVPMLARVEGMPLDALRQTLPLDWRSTGEYFDRIRGQIAINAGFSVGHSTLRRVVMGPDATRREAVEHEVDAMASLLRAGLAAGAIGFSTSRGTSHQDAAGDPVPSRFASPEECVALAGVCREFPGTSLELVPAGWEFTEEEVDMIPRMSAAADRPLNWNLIVANAANLERFLRQLELSDRAQGVGGKVVALVQPLEFPARFNFLSAFVLDGLPNWGPVMALPVPERLAFLRDPDKRRWLAEQAATTTTRKSISDWGAKIISETFHEDNKRFEGRVVADIAAERGVDPFDALVDIVCLDELRTTFTRIPTPDTPEDWDARRRLWTDPRTLIGGSDAGAHLDFLATFNYTTYLLGTGVREQEVLSLEEAVKLLTADPADLYGLHDRGRLQVGHRADIVVFDPSSVASEPVRMRADVPGGSSRLYAGSRGVEHVLVAGTSVVEDGRMTDALPGALLRAGTDTTTPALV